MAALLEAKGVTKVFGGLTAVDRVDLTIEKGSIASLIGPNGAGKTTFFNCLTGLYQPEKGSITFDGHSLVGQRSDQIIGLGIARTYQNIRLFKGMTVLENVLVGQHVRMKATPLGAVLRTPSQRAEERQAREFAQQLLEFVGLGGEEETLSTSSMPFAPNAYLTIDTDGAITVLVDRSEMGQGVATALPQLLAEELDDLAQRRLGLAHDILVPELMEIDAETIPVDQV